MSTIRHRRAPLPFRMVAVAASVITLMVIAGCGGEVTETSITIPVVPTTPSTLPPDQQTTTTMEPEGGTGRLFYVYSPSVGDCIDLRVLTDGMARTTRRVPGTDATIRASDQVIVRFDCGVPHQYEVMEIVSAGFPDPTVATDDEFIARARALCAEPFEAFVGLGYPNSTLEIGWYLPTADQRARGVQRIGCLVFDPKGKLVGSVRGSAR